MLGPSVDSIKWNLFLKSLDYWPGALPSDDLKQGHENLKSKIIRFYHLYRVKGLLKIKHLMRIFNLMDFLFLKIELPVTSILQYLKTFNWSQCIQAKIDSNIPSPGRKGSLKIPTRCPATPANFDKHSNSSLYLQYQGFTVPIIENIESPSWFSFT